MLNTSQLIATVSAYKRHTRTILSVMTLLTLSPLVQAAGNNHADDSLNKDAIIPISYCYNGKKDSPSTDSNIVGISLVRIFVWLNAG